MPGTCNGKSILAVVVVRNDDTIISPRAQSGKEAFKVKRIQALQTEHMDLSDLEETESKWDESKAKRMSYFRDIDEVYMRKMKDGSI